MLKRCGEDRVGSRERDGREIFKNLEKELDQRGGKGGNTQVFIFSIFFFMSIESCIKAREVAIM